MEVASHGVGLKGAEPKGAEPIWVGLKGAEPKGAEPIWAEPKGAEPIWVGQMEVASRVVGPFNLQSGLTRPSASSSTIGEYALRSHAITIEGRNWSYLPMKAEISRAICELR